MTENRDSLENAIVEKVNDILKDELLKEHYANYKQAQQAVAIAVSVYIHQQPHSSISYKMPAEVHLGKEPVQRKSKTYYSNYVSQNVEIAY